MKKLKEKVLKTIILLTVVSSTLPFFCHDVYADTTVPVTYNSQSTQSQWSSHLTVTNYCESPLQGSTPCKLTFILDDDYYGMISFDGYAGSSLALSYVTVFVAGGIGEYNYRTFSNANPMYINSINIMGVGLHLPDSNVDLTDIIDLLTAIESDTTAIDTTVDTTLSTIQSLLNQAIISNDYLETLTQLRQWNFPIESYAFVYKFFKSNLNIVDFKTNNYYSYPLFLLPTNSDLLKSKWSHGTDADDMVMILGINKNVHNRTELERNFTLDNFKFISLTPIEREDLGSPFTIIKVIYNIQSTSSGNYATLIPKLDLNIMPIYNDFLYNTKFTSSEFALMYGLSNQLVDDIHLIAQGTQSSSSSSSDLEDSSSDFDDVAGDVYNLENSFNTGLNNSLQQIDTSFDVGNTFGSKFLLAADWVRVQFNTITASNPFGTILSFSLLLGVALLIIGKVLG